MSIPNNWGDWRPNLTPHTGDLQATDLIECTMIVGGIPINTAITGQQIIDAASGGGAAGYYAMYQDNITQTAAVINTGYPIKFRTLDYSNGVSVVSDSRITIANTGVYNLQFSVQLENSSTHEHDVTIWLRKNGVDVTGSSGFVSVASSHGGVHGHVLPAWNYLLDVIGGDYYELVWSVSSTAVTMPYYSGSLPPPSAASAIFTVTQQAGIIAGTGITALNGLSGAVQTISTGTTGTDFNVVSSGTDHKFNIPTASATNRGALSTTDWSTFNSKQDTLISGTNIKTINSTSLLGSGDIVIGGGGLTVGTTAIASGTIGGILFQNGSNLLAQDAALFWDNTNKRLGVGATPSTSVRLDVRAAGALSTDVAFRVRNSANTGNIFQINGDGSVVTNAINLGNTPASNFTAPFLSITNGGSTSLSFATMSNNLYNFNIDRYCNLATNGAGANTNGAGALLLGLGATPSTRNYQLTVAGLNAISQGTNDSGFAQTGADTSSNNAMYVNYIGKNWTIGGTLQGNGKRVFSIITGTAPTTNVLDGFQQYSADIVAGNAAPHFRTENGNIIKLYQQPTGGAASTFVTNTSLIANDTATFDGYTIGQVVKALRNMGILA